MFDCTYNLSGFQFFPHFCRVTKVATILFDSAEILLLCCLTSRGMRDAVPLLVSNTVVTSETK